MTLRPLPASGTTRVMGVLNVTPDSFSDGGRFGSADEAVAAGERLVADGADVLDVGAVSTRPGAAPVDPEAEWTRLAPVLLGLRARVPVPISLDTCSSLVLERALEIGVDLLNDVSALHDDPRIASVAASAAIPVVLMHRRGTPATMQLAPHFDDAPAEVLDELGQALRRAEAAGIRPEDILLDPGIGFGKRLEDNLALLAALPRLVASGQRWVLGCSRKSFLGALTGRPVDEREHATTATTALAALAGVDFVRVHDVKAARDVLAVLTAVAHVARS